MTPTLRPSPWSLAMVAALAPIPVAAVQDTTQTDTTITRMVTFAVPEAPAVAFVNGSRKDITRPGSVRDLAAALISGIDSAGRVRQGFGLEVAGGFFKSTWDAADYASLFGGIVQNSSVSVAAVRTSGDSASTDLGFGLRLPVFDRSDINGAAGRAFLLERLDAAAEECLPEGPVPEGGEHAVSECIGAAGEKARKEWYRSHWNDFTFGFALAGRIRLDSSLIDRRRDGGWGGWALLTAPLCLSASEAAPCRWGQWSFEGRREVLKNVADTVSNWAVGGRVTVGTEQVGLFAEFVHVWRSVRPAPATLDTRIWEWSAGVEFRVSDDLWAATGLGSRFADATGKSQVVLIAGLRINVAEQRQLRVAGSR